MKRHSHINGFVVFPSKEMEADWLHLHTVQRISNEQLADKFEALLNTAKTEQQIHAFFEEHPQFLPGVGYYHNGPRGDIVITKLPLGLDFVTDFAFVSENSQMVQFTCVEIEGPRVSLFGRGAQFSRAYLDAKQQITDWNLWAQQNLREAIHMFDRLGNWLPPEYYKISLQCILVAGRRSELSTLKRKERWAAEDALRHASMTIMTYDRLIDEIRSGYRSWRQKMLVCSSRDRALHVKHISI
jgi:hypothetical protein